jgi:hypothetical protein
MQNGKKVNLTMSAGAAQQSLFLVTNRHICCTVALLCDVDRDTCGKFI